MASSISRSEWYAEMRKQCAGKPMQVALLEHYETRDPNDGAEYPSVLPACPPWCRCAEQNHDYSDHTDDGVFIRYHEWSTGAIDAWVSQEERNRDGVVTFGPVLIQGEATGSRDGITVEQACVRVAEWQALIVTALEAQR